MTKQKNTPSHVAVIMDGNGRWASEQYLPRILGHKAGIEPARICIKEAVKHGISHLSLFMFSTENWNRPSEEVSAIFNLLTDTLNNEIKELHQQQVRVRFIGDTALLPDGLKVAIAKSEELTKENVKLNLYLGLSYGGRWDIVNVTKKLLSSKAVELDQLTELMLDEAFKENSIPDIDLLNRTGRQKRISNFALWQMAYAEILFLDQLWPDFDEKNFGAALDYFKNIDRRFGKIKNV